MPYADPKKRLAYAKAYNATPEAKAKRDAYRAATRKENAERQRAYYAANKESCIASTKNAARKRLYGISTDEMRELFAAQNEQCACCGTKEPGSKRGWHIDHGHETGKVRGILCHHCNVAAGMAQDDLKIIQAAVKYLKRGGSTAAIKVMKRQGRR